VKLLRRIGVGAAIVAVLAYAMVLGVMYVFQRDFQYDRSGRLLALSETKLDGTELVSIPSSDGSSVAGWYEPPAEGMPVILFFRAELLARARAVRSLDRGGLRLPRLRLPRLSGLAR
jgi:uncharacterized protein